MDHPSEMPTDGSVTPPPRVPPLALATTPPEPPSPARRGVGRFRLAELVDEALDALDRLGDRIAGAAGLR